MALPSTRWRVRPQPFAESRIEAIPRMGRASGYVAMTIALLLIAGCIVTSPNPTPAYSDGQSPSETAMPTSMPTPTPVPTWMALINWDSLRRPLTLPSIGPGSECPVTSSSTTEVEGFTVLGSGPIYPWGSGQVKLADLFLIQGVYRLKVLWMIDFERYDGPALIRGQRIDGPSDRLVFYGRDQNATQELRLGLEGWVSGGSGLREFNSGTGFPGAGCFAYQVDATELQEWIVVEVTEN